MSDVNVVVVSGTMGKSFPKMVKFGEREMVVTSFSLASTETYDNKAKKTIVRCSAWGEALAKEIKLLSEGDIVIVQGKIASRKDESKDIWVTEISVAKISLAGESHRTEPLPF